MNFLEINQILNKMLKKNKTSILTLKVEGILFDKNHQ